MDQLRPKTVAFKTAQLLLGGAARSTLYKWANEGKLKLVKRGNKTEAELDSIDALNLKPTRVGGLTKAARIRDLAQASGLKILLDEPQGADLATAALAELAATIDPGHFLGTGCFIGPHMPFSYQKAGPSGPGPQFDDGTLQRGNAPGLGVDVDENVLGPPVFQLAR